MAQPLRSSGWPTLDPGELHHKVKIQRPIESQDATGALKQTWVTFIETYVGIDPFGGGEKWADANLASTNVFKMKLHYVKGITTKMRVSHDGRMFDIQNVENVEERDRVLILKCMERLYDEQGVRVQ
jgi:head-tail adaptor